MRSFATLRTTVSLWIDLPSSSRWASVRPSSWRTPMLRRALLVFTAAAMLATPAWAQETRRVRATIEKVDGSTLYVKTRDGEDLKITLADKPVFMAIVPATLADLKPGTFVGSGATPGPDGSLVAMEVHIFPEAMRGTGEGHRPMA